jgi:hypothetical protein
MSSENNSNSNNKFYQVKKPPLPFSTIGRSYSTLNKLLSTDILGPHRYPPTSNQLELPDASNSYRSSQSYTPPSNTSMLFGTVSSHRRVSSTTKVKSSSPNLFRNSEKQKENYNTDMNNYNTRKKSSYLDNTSFLHASSKSLHPLSKDTQVSSSATTKKKRFSTLSSSGSFLSKKRHSIESLIGFCNIFFKVVWLIERYASFLFLKFFF